MKKLLLASLAFVLAFTACDDDESDNYIATGVYLDGKEIVIKDRNVGASKVGDAGSYLTWDEAKTACPAGYHLMTWAEADALADNTNYNTSDKLTGGKLKLPAAGFIYEDETEVTSLGVGGCLWLAEEYDGDESWYWGFSNYGVKQYNYYSKACKMTVRCVRGAAPVGSTIPD